jgi:dihydroxy-acid dehydratase
MSASPISTSFAGRVPVIANLRPSGAWLMEDFHIAGGTRALLRRLEGMLHLELRRSRARWARASRARPSTTTTSSGRWTSQSQASGGTAILYGNLAPDGCVIKPPAAEARLLQHTGPAIVFDSL